MGEQFDCIRMKRDIHAKMDILYAGLSTEEFLKRMREDLQKPENPFHDVWIKVLNPGSRDNVA